MKFNIYATLFVKKTSHRWIKNKLIINKQNSHIVLNTGNLQSAANISNLATDRRTTHWLQCVIYTTMTLQHRTWLIFGSSGKWSQLTNHLPVTRLSWLSKYASRVYVGNDGCSPPYNRQHHGVTSQKSTQGTVTSRRRGISAEDTRQLSSRCVAVVQWSAGVVTASSMM